MILAVDGNHNLHRVLHVKALQELASGGKKTGGVYGALNTVRGVLDSFPITKCIVVWDGYPVPEYRTCLCPTYKANRTSDEDDEEQRQRREDFKFQKKLLEVAFKQLGCHSISVPEAEGDDLLYAVTKIYPDERIILMSEDMDLAQLVNLNVSLWRPRKEEHLTVNEFQEVTGVVPALFVLRKALMGDTSDNVPGVKGVGKKRASQVLQEFTESQQMNANPHHLFREFRSFCAGHKSTPIKRIAEKFDTVMSNVGVMDLSRYPWDNETLGEVRDRLSVRVQCDTDAARDFFSRLQFKSLLTYFSAWVQPFLSLR